MTSVTVHPPTMLEAKVVAVVVRVVAEVVMVDHNINSGHHFHYNNIIGLFHHGLYHGNLGPCHLVCT